MKRLKRIKKLIKLGSKKAGHQLALRSYLTLGRPEPKPEKLYYLISNKCNYQCGMCPQWKAGIEENAAQYLSLERMKEIINEMADLGIGELGISGGEPLLQKEKLLSLLEYANQKGIYTHFATNGSLLNEEVLKKYDQIGGGHISLSIDAIGEKHDQLRGAQGAFIRAENALRLWKKNNYKNVALKINFTLSNENLGDALKVARLAIENQAMIFIQPYDPYAYGCEEKETKFPLWVKKENMEKLNNVVRDLTALKKEYPQVILNSREGLLALKNYFREEKTGASCVAALNQVSLNPYGKIIFCKFGEIGDLNRSSLKEYFNGGKRKEIIKAGLACGEGCMLGCMYDFPLKDMFLAGVSQLKRLMKN